MPWYDPFCSSEQQKRVMDAHEMTSSSRAVAQELGIDDGQVRKTVRSVKAKAAKAGVSPEAQLNFPAPTGFVTPGVTAQYDGDGTLKQAWMKYKPEEVARLAAIATAIGKTAEVCKPYKKIKAPQVCAKDLLTAYHFTDYHLGMYAWSKECGPGNDWDMDIAEKVYMSAITDLMDRSPDSETAIFAQMGDFLHWDGLLAVTPTGNNVLDADTRYDKLVELAMRITVKTVQLLAQKHKYVIDIQMEGNHDVAGSVWLRKHHKIMFEKTRRITVDDTVFPYYGMLWNTNFLGFHHGHKVSNKKVAEFFAASPQFRKMWGQADRTYIKTGHLHQSEGVLSEVGGAIVERYPTLAAADAYAARGGWNSYRGATAVTYHKTKGQYSSVSTVPVEVKAEYIK
jgi:hypothetical protein